jgi:hypothetical protein
MGVVKEISCSRSVRVNTGQYEGTEYFVSMKMELDDLDDEAVEADRLALVVEEAIGRQLFASYKVRGKNLNRAQIAKQHGLGRLVDGAEK